MQVKDKIKPSNQIKGGHLAVALPTILLYLFPEALRCLSIFGQELVLVLTAFSKRPVVLLYLYSCALHAPNSLKEKGTRRKGETNFHFANLQTYLKSNYKSSNDRTPTVLPHICYQDQESSLVKLDRLEKWFQRWILLLFLSVYILWRYFHLNNGKLR